MTKITKVIHDLLKSNEWSEYNPSTINQGNCDSFAFDIEQQVKGSEAVWADMWIESMPPDCSEIFNGLCISHCFVEYNDKYYDSECPNGVNHPIQLPFFDEQILDFPT